MIETAKVTEGTAASDDDGRPPALELKGITKRFGSVLAVDGVSFSVASGQVVALLGDNGAGKSTLIKMISGALSPDGGQILLDGKILKMRSSKDARRAGIATVYQDLGLVPAMNVWRNFFLGAELRRGLGLDVAKMRSESERALRDIGLQNLSSVDQNVGKMSGGERQALSIGRAVYFEGRLLVLDEPTAALSVKETQKVLEYVRQAQERELGVVLVMHNVPQALTMSDRVVVMRHGRIAGTFDVAGQENLLQQVNEMIIGTEIEWSAI